MLKNIKIENFRCFKSKFFSFDKKICVIFGNNGSGKTSVLECISLFTQGQGCRYSLKEATRNNENNWYIKGEIFKEEERQEIYLKGKKNYKGKEISVNGIKTNQIELLKIIKIIWITPCIEENFCKNSFRIKYLDRLISNVNLQHAKNLLYYYKLLKKRNDIIQANKIFILPKIEEMIYESSCKIDIERKNFLQSKYFSNKNSQNYICTHPNSYIHDKKHFLNLLHNNRNERNRIGCHCSTWKIKKENLEYSQCSKGEQKSILLEIIMNFIEQNNDKYIILLDEINAYLDNNTRKHVFSILSKSKHQFFLTGINKNFFEEIYTQSCFINLNK